MTPKAVNRLRKRLKLTQQQLADFIGAQRHTVSRWQIGESRPRGANLKALRELQKKAKKEISIKTL
jgi:DNA-binding transcriptional regulator YiaG